MAQKLKQIPLKLIPKPAEGTRKIWPFEKYFSHPRQAHYLCGNCGETLVQSPELEATRWVFRCRKCDNYNEIDQAVLPQSDSAWGAPRKDF
jgi:DNA-directed RNA polymerase subunit RPC12/RpoP